MTEDEVVASFARYLGGESWDVLVARASQVSLSVSLPNGGRKAPDVVAAKDGVLLVVQAKSRATNLSKPDLFGVSDCAFLLAVATSDGLQDKLMALARARRPGLSVSTVRVASLSGSPHADARPCGEAIVHFSRVGDDDDIFVAI